MGGTDGYVELRRVVDGAPIRRLIGHQGYVRDLAFSPDGEALVSAGGDGTVRLWSVATGRETGVLLDLPPHPNSFDYRDGRSVPQQRELWSVTFSPDGGVVAVGDDSAQIFLVALGTPTVSQTLQGHVVHGHRPIVDMAFSSDGRLLVTAGEHLDLQLWSATDGTYLGALEAPDFYVGVRGIAVGPNDATAAVVQGFGEVDLWSLQERRLLTSFEVGLQEVRSGAFDAGLAHVAVGGGTTNDDMRHIPLLRRIPDARIVVTPMDAGKPKIWLRGHRDNVEGLAFSPDGRLLASVSWDRTVRLWNVR